MSERVLIVDDDVAVTTVLAGIVAQEGWHPLIAHDAHEALAVIGEADVVVSDVRMPGMDGMALLQTLVGSHPDIPVVMLTAHGTVSLAVEAMKLGAADFLLKPFERDAVVYAVRKALTLATHRAKKPASATHESRLLGQSEAMDAVRQTLERVAPTNATVLLRGETGTGKELAARALHRASKRASGPFVAVDCASLPGALLESELFGHERGAFTGATSRKPGRVVLADGGTLFLDEIGELPVALQPKLLRMLQERVVTPVGSNAPLDVDVRVVAATHRDLESMVQEGTFREDLFYRLAVVPVVLPSLADRRDDIPRLVRAFLARAREDHGREVRFEDGAVHALALMPWPGNVRQLQNAVERLVIMSEGLVVDVAQVEALAPQPLEARAGTLEASVEQAERAALRSALVAADGNRTLAARLLGISRRTLYNKLEEHGVS